MVSGRWADSDRKDDLPPDWWKIAQRVKERDGHRCKFILPSGKRCPRTEELEVDHMYGRRNHAMWALRTLCKHHHKQVTAQQAIQGRNRRKPKRERRVEQHPGLRR